MSNGLIWTICIGIVAGFLAGKIMKGSGFGVIGSCLLLYPIRLVKKA